MGLLSRADMTTDSRAESRLVQGRFPNVPIWFRTKREGASAFISTTWSFDSSIKPFNSVQQQNQAVQQ
jgi:hypothetical protein